jgi:iron(III) transport system ATP-binding protein
MKTTTTAETNDDANGHFLEVRGLSKQFGAFTALDNVSMGVRQGEFVSVLGPSGCGKTTLLRVIAGLEPQNSGSVWIGGRDVSREPVASRGLGIVFQSYALFPNISVAGNVQYGLRGRGAALRLSRAMEMLDLVGLADQAAKYPAQLSGGQQQRVALARALAPNPSLLLLDEPLSALDARVRVRLRGEIRRIQSKLGVTTIMVTHDQEEALTMADRVVVMDRGRLMQYCAPQHLYASPVNPFVAGFVGAMNFLPQCRREGPHRVRFLDYPLEVAGCKDPLHGTGESFMLAIRPEHVRPAADGPDQGENRIRAAVRHVEFRGAVSRVQLRILHPEGAPSALTLEMDLQPKAADHLNPGREGELDIHLPARHLLAYAQDADVRLEREHVA